MLSSRLSPQYADGWMAKGAANCCTLALLAGKAHHMGGQHSGTELRKTAVR